MLKLDLTMAGNFGMNNKIRDRESISKTMVFPLTRVEMYAKLMLKSDVGIHPLSNFTIIVNPKFSNIESLGRLIQYASGFSDKDLQDDQM